MDKHRQRVVITGGGSGLGRALAHRYARAGWTVAVADLVRERADAVRDELRAAGASAESFAVDVGDDATVEALRDAVLAALGGIEHVINNAGVSSAGTLAETAIDDWRWMLEINLLGVVRGCRAFTPVLAAQGRGHVLNVASFAGLAGAPGLAAYGTAKAAVVALSEALRAELAGRGVGVSVLCPAFFQTRLLENFRGPESARAQAAKWMQRAPISADDVADFAYAGMQRGRFLLIPTARERRFHHLKRLLPEFYFRRLIAAVRARSPR